MWDTLAHVLVSSNCLLHGFLREIEATLTGEVFFTQRDREEGRREDEKPCKFTDRETREGQKERERKKEIKYYLSQENNTEQGIGRIDFETSLV